MKALLVADTDVSVHAISDTIEPYGFDIIRYRSPVKALDNVDEIAPDAVFISAGDFPRHWKTIVQYIRSDTGKDRTVIVLLVTDRFTAEDADKAVHIGVQAIVGETMTGGNDVSRLVEVFSRYRYVGPETHQRVFDAVGERMVFMFTNPLNDMIITGKLDSVSSSTLMFRPDSPSAVADLSSGERVTQCTLMIDGAEFAPSCVVRKTGNFMILDMSSPGTDLIASIERVVGSQAAGTQAADSVPSVK